MPVEILRHTLQNVVAKMIQHVGFDHASVDAVDILVDVLYNYLKTLTASIADVGADDGFYSVLDGVAILDLMNEPLSDLLYFAAEVGNFLPCAAPVLCVPLAGKISITLPPKDKHKLAYAIPPTPQPLHQDTEIPAMSPLCKETKVTETPITLGRPERSLPPWACRVRYQMMRVSYDSNAHELVEHELPPPIALPAGPTSSATRRSSRSAVSVFRRPSTVTVPSPSVQFDDLVSLPHLPVSPKPARSSEEAWAAALKAPMPTSPTPTRKSCITRSPPLPPAILPPPIELHKPSTPKVSAPRVTLSNKRRGRKMRLSMAKKRTAKRPAPVSIATPSEHTHAIFSPLLSHCDDNSPPPEFADCGSPTSIRYFPMSTKQEMKHQSPPLTPEIVKPTTSKEIFSTIYEEDGSSPDMLSTEGRAKFLSPVLRVLPEPSVALDLPANLPVIASSSVYDKPLPLQTPEKEKIFVSPPLFPESPAPSDSSTIPLMEEEDNDYGGRGLESPHLSPVPKTLPSILHFPATATRHRSRNHSSSSSSSSSLSSPSSASTSTATALDVTAVVAPTAPPSLVSIAASAPEHPSRLLESVADRLTISCPSKTGLDSDNRGGLRIKIRLGGSGGTDIDGVRSLATVSRPRGTFDAVGGATTSSNSSSTSSSSVCTPSQDSNADEANARRHSAIPTAILTTTRPHILDSNLSIYGKTEPKAPKLVIKFGGSGTTSSTVQSIEPPTDGSGAFHREKLRGSSISSLESSSSSSSSSISDGGAVEEVTQSRLHVQPHNLSCLPALTATPTPPPMLSLIPTNYRDRSVDRKSATTVSGRFSSSASSLHSKKTTHPPSLRPLHASTQPPVPGPSVVGSAPSKAVKLNKRKSKTNNRKELQKAPPKPDAIPYKVNMASGKRALVNSVFSDDEEDVFNAPVTSGSVAKRMKVDSGAVSSTVTNTTQVVVSSGGTSYYFNSEGSQIWLCPICRTEEQDGLFMIGCDSCDDWYHGQCVGFNEAPTDDKWYCPTCQENSTRVASSSTSKGSRHHNNRRRRPENKSKRH